MYYGQKVAMCLKTMIFALLTELHDVSVTFIYHNDRQVALSGLYSSK